VNILLSVPGFTEDTLFSTSARDGVQQPFVVLRDALTARGHVLYTPDIWDGSPVDALLAWDMPPHDLYDTVVWRHGSLHYHYVHKVLITGEPPVVRPDNWYAFMHDLFDTVLTWHDALVDNTFYRKFYWPQTTAIGAVTDVSFDTRKLITNISGNKHSTILGELYSARRSAIRYFERCLPDQFDLYGAGWDASAYPSYKGAPAHKVDVLPQYRFALVYENMIAPGWITEKLFDVLRCGVVPVYLGASNIEQYVPSDVFVDMRAFDNLDVLIATLGTMGAGTWQGYRDAAETFLNSEAFTKWLPDAFVQTVSEALGL
jgi:hypothetical protein